ncbi:VanW family protein [Litchfieldia alkalitelluris]|uniref:VanW family protein n=1 Tax=Litchfieldia alkalitelluris TaxID=304268 RepID=UPI001F254D77|nr:VanW family protein [Litchfieldia alkalitelluris]
MLVSILLFIVPVTSTNNPDLVLNFKGETIATINKEAFSSPLVEIPLINEELYNQFLTKLNQQVHHPPTNAIINEKNEIIPGKDGYQLDRQKFTQEFINYFFNDEPLTIEIPITQVHQRVDAELLSDIRVKQIGSYVTYYNNRHSERSNNIVLATEAINNHVIFQGETFSFNEVVGKRTKEKGYLPAPIIIKGELYEGVGGGICQVSSTLFNAVDNAGVKIIQRYSHSRNVNYVPSGRDATVSWYGPDFTFKNVYNQPILIRAKADKGKVYIGIYSSDAINFKQN